MLRRGVVLLISGIGRSVPVKTPHFNRPGVELLAARLGKVLHQYASFLSLRTTQTVRTMMYKSSRSDQLRR